MSQRVPASLSAGVVIALLLSASACIFAHGQRYRDFSTGTPLETDHYLVVGFMGGREPWDNEKRWVRKLALKLRSMRMPGVHVETVENKKRALALELIRKALDRNGDGALDRRERGSAHLIVYGHSFGGAAVVKLARQLQQMDLPVLLTVQIDSVGRDDALIPANVRRAANLYQSQGWFIRGQAPIQAEDPSKTEILGNFEYDYRGKSIDLSEVSWFKRLFRVAHTKMGHDPEVWAKVEELILQALPETLVPKH